MGLDMYLDKEIFVGSEYEHRKITGAIELFQDGEPIPVEFGKVSRVVESAGYWRKANAIHNWFVEHVQDGVDNCGRYYVSHDQMQELLDLVNRVLEGTRLVKGVVVNGQHMGEDGEWVNNYESGETVDDPELAHKLLPTTSGFFFGSTDYDQWYIQDLRHTKEILEAALADKIGNYYYHSSW